MKGASTATRLSSYCSIWRAAGRLLWSTGTTSHGCVRPLRVRRDACALKGRCAPRLDRWERAPAEAQLRSHAWGLAERRPTFAVHAPRDGADGAKACAFIMRAAGHGIHVEAAPDLQEALARADVVITATPAVVPIVTDAWVAPGTHLNAMGADAPGKQELDNDLVGRCRLFADDRDQSARSVRGGASQSARTW